MRGIGIEAGGQQEDGVEIGDGFAFPPLVVKGICGGDEAQTVGVITGRAQGGGISGDGFVFVTGMAGDEAQW